MENRNWKIEIGNWKSLISNFKPQISNPGFTLIETLVAMMILAISLTVIMQLFSGGLKASRLSDEYSRAVFHAREKMEEILLVDELANGISKGEFDDGFKWYAEIFYLLPEEEEEENKNKTTKMPVDMFRITVKVSWQEGEREKEFEIRTLKIGTLISEANEEVRSEK